MSGPTRDAAQSRGRRLVAVVLIATLAAWLGGQWAGVALGLPLGAMLVLDLAALAAFGWAMWTTWRLWRGGAGQGRQ